MPEQNFLHGSLIEKNGRRSFFKIFHHGRCIAGQDVVAVIVEAEDGFHSQRAALEAEITTLKRIIPLGSHLNAQQHVQQQ